jgi:hypothetical protein
MCHHGNRTHSLWHCSFLYCWPACLCQQYEMHLSLHVKCPLFLSAVNQMWTFLTDVSKVTNIKFYENLRWMNGWTDTHDKAKTYFFTTYVTMPKRTSEETVMTHQTV